ncbi:SCARECROW-like [Hordeum vulgare]|nr:SCARECROW-like [Hordeum vulgare]
MSLRHHLGLRLHLHRGELFELPLHRGREEHEREIDASKELPEKRRPHARSYSSVSRRRSDDGCVWPHYVYRRAARLRATSDLTQRALSGSSFLWLPELAIKGGGMERLHGGMEASTGESGAMYVRREKERREEDHAEAFRLVTMESNIRTNVMDRLIEVRARLPWKIRDGISVTPERLGGTHAAPLPCDPGDDKADGGVERKSGSEADWGDLETGSGGGNSVVSSLAEARPSSGSSVAGSSHGDLESGQGRRRAVGKRDLFGLSARDRTYSEFSWTSLDSSGLLFPSTSRADAFLGALWGLSPKVIVVAKQEASHNYCAALFDRLEVGAARGSVECARVERWLLGEELKNIGASDGAERRERHKRLDRWATRMEGASFGRVLLSYYALLQARRAAQGLGCDGFKVREEKGIFFLCSQDRALFSVSAWRGRRFD